MISAIRSRMNVTCLTLVLVAACMTAYQLHTVGWPGFFYFRPSQVIPLGLLMLVAGLAIPPRFSFGGELHAAWQLALLCLFAMLVIPAALLPVHILGFLTSFLAWAVYWTVWALAVLVVGAGHVLGWAALLCLGIGGILLLNDNEEGGAFIGAGFFASIALIVLYGGLEQLYFFSKVKKLYMYKYDIPNVDFVYVHVERFLLNIKWGYFVCILLNACLGLALGFLGALGLRGARQALMMRTGLRPFLPMAIAPVNDRAQVIPKEFIAPVWSILFVIWATYLIVSL